MVKHAMHLHCNPEFIPAHRVKRFKLELMIQTGGGDPEPFYPPPFSQSVNVLQPYALCETVVVPQAGEFSLQVPRAQTCRQTFC